MIIFIYGNDEYRIRQTVNQIIEEHRKKNPSGLNTLSFDFGADIQKTGGGQDDAPALELGQSFTAKTILEDIENALKTMPFFSEKRIIIVGHVANSTAKTEFAKMIEYWKLKDDQEIILVVFEYLAGKELSTKAKGLFKVLERDAQKIKEINRLSGKKLGEWIAKECQRLGTKISAAGIKKLLEYTSSDLDKKSGGPDSWALRQEIEKLANYAPEEIMPKDVQALVVPPVNENIFAITDAYGEKNHVRAFSLLYKNLNDGSDEHFIFSMLVYQFRNLLSVKSLEKSAVPFEEIIKKSGLHPYVARKTLVQSKKFDLDELKQKFLQLAQIEIMTKNGVADLTDELFGLAFH